MQPEGPPLFIDRNAWSNALHRSLQSARIAHEAHRWHFPQTDIEAEVDDTQWLAFVAARGWPIVTRDKRIRYKVNELAAMRAARLHVFVFTQGGLTGEDTGRLLVDAYPAILKAVETTSPPTFFSLLSGGRVTRLSE